MKKTILFSAVIIILAKSTFIYSQSKYGYAIIVNQVPDGHWKYYLSYVQDLTELDCSTTPKNNRYGTKNPPLDFFAQCIEIWFDKKLKGKGISTTDFYHYNSVGKPGRYNGCINRDELGCFFLTKEEAEKNRQEMILYYKAKNVNNSIIEID